jgi:hypothetical protein
MWKEQHEGNDRVRGAIRWKKQCKKNSNSRRTTPREEWCERNVAKGPMRMEQEVEEQQCEEQ